MQDFYVTTRGATTFNNSKSKITMTTTSTFNDQLLSIKTAFITAILLLSSYGTPLLGQGSSTTMLSGTVAGAVLVNNDELKTGHRRSGDWDYHLQQRGNYSDQRPSGPTSSGRHVRGFKTGGHGGAGAAGIP